MPRSSTASNWLKGQKVAKGKGRDKAKTHGHIPGVPIGTTFKNRVDCAGARVHAPLRAGIHGNGKDGAYSIVMSYGYEDDEDNGETFIYSGEGGRNTAGSKMDQMRGKELWDGPRSADQDWQKTGNKALKLSSKTKKPIRVIRGQSRKFYAKYAPAEGYRYDGLYQVEKAWEETGKSGFKTCRFLFVRMPGQPPLPQLGYIAGKYKAGSKASSEDPALCRATSALNITNSDGALSSESSEESSVKSLSRSVSPSTSSTETRTQKRRNSDQGPKIYRKQPTALEQARPDASGSNSTRALPISLSAAHTSKSAIPTSRQPAGSNQRQNNPTQAKPTSPTSGPTPGWAALLAFAHGKD